MSSTQTHNTSIRAAYKGKDGKIRKSHLAHINDGGIPLCRVKSRDNFTDGGFREWVLGFESPTCSVCLRFNSRQHKGAIR